MYSPYFQRKYERSFRFFVADFTSGTSGHWLANSQHNNFLDNYGFK